MGYLIQFDYERLIQDVTLKQIISTNLKLIPPAELAGITEVRSYLRAKYDVDAEFTNTVLYNHGATYKAANRVYLDAGFYNEKATYALNVLTLRQGKVYVCTTAIAVAEEFTIGHWKLLGDQGDIFYCAYPKDVFELSKLYEKDDQVFWKDKVYTCQIATNVIGHNEQLQFNSTASLPYPNVFPDDPKSGAKYWGAGTPYTVPAGSLIPVDEDAPVYWVKGDNRNQQLILYGLDIIIYHLYRRIPPAIVPEIRIFAYQQAVSWLKNVSKSNDVVAEITKNQPPAGNMIRYGSRVKSNNYY